MVLLGRAGWKATGRAHGVWEEKKCGLGQTWVLGRGWKLGLGCYGFPPLFYFLIQTNSNQTNYLNSNFEFEFYPNTQTK